MSPSTIKYYVVPGAILLAVIVIVIIISNSKPADTNSSTQQALSSSASPTPRSLLSVPTIIPPQSFTGAETTQVLPPNLKNIGEQKTILRRLTPHTLPFATIEFDYELDLFLVLIADPKDENLNQFVSWRDQNYPALSNDKFIFY